MALLAQTTFSTGTDNTLAVIDGYDKISSSIKINKVSDINGLDLDQKYTDLIRPSLDNLKIIQNVDFDNKLKLDPQALKEGILSSSGGAMSAFKSLPPDIQNKLLETTGYSKIKTTINGVDEIIENGDYKTITGLTTMIRDISNCEFPVKILDQAGLIALITNLIKQASMFNIGDSYTAFLNCLNDLSLSAGITSNLIPHVAKNGDVNLLKAIADGPHKKEVKTQHPNFIDSFTSQFKLPNGTKESTMRTLLDSTTGSFNKIDPNWNKKGDRIDATKLANSSDDFKKLLKCGRESKTIDWLDADYSDLDTSPQLTDNDKLFAIVDIADKSNNTITKIFDSSNQLLKNSFPLLA